MKGRSFHFANRCIELILAMLLITPVPGMGQINNPAYADYLLVGQFGEICTMCEAVVLCENADAETQRENIPADGSFTLYHLQTRTFWSQVATIWEWFITNFDPDSLAVAGHRRPVMVYTITDGSWSKPQTLAAHVSLDPATIVIGDDAIDRIESRWLRGLAMRPAGFCQRLPLWDSLETIAAQSPAEPAS